MDVNLQHHLLQTGVLYGFEVVEESEIDLSLLRVLPVCPVGETLYVHPQRIVARPYQYHARLGPNRAALLPRPIRHFRLHPFYLPHASDVSAVRFRRITSDRSSAIPSRDRRRFPRGRSEAFRGGNRQRE